MKQHHPEIDLGSRWQRKSRWTGVAEPGYVVVVVRTKADRFFTKREGDPKAEVHEWYSSAAFRDCYEPAADSTLPAVYLTPAEHRVLAALSRLCGRLGRPPKLHELAAECGVTPQSVDRVLRSADEAGYTTRAQGLARPLRQRVLTARGYTALASRELEAAE